MTYLFHLVTIKPMDESARLYERLLKAHRAWDEQIKADREAKIKAVPQKLKLYRHIHNLSRADLAKELEVTRMEIFRWEEGRNIPEDKFLRKMEEMKII